MGANRSVRTCVRNGTPDAPTLCTGAELGEGEGETDGETELLGETDAEGDTLALGLTDADADETVSSNATSSMIGAVVVQPVDAQVSPVRVATRVCTWVVMAAASF
jgi:hypothetical protein